MSIRNLEYLFRPHSVAVIGASNRPHSVGATVMRNLLAGGFEGPIMPVNPKHEAVAGVLAYPDVASLPLTPDLAIICTPPASVPKLIEALGARGTRAAVVLTAGLSAQDASGRPLQDAMLAAAKPHLLRILGPNCVGLLTPGLGLNASFAHTTALPGKIAFVSQSGALATAILDWATSQKIGFSHFISLGNSADVDFGDTLDYLASDPQTEAILLYIESIKAARKFMSAARASARNKPVLAVKVGRAPEGAKAAASHTGALAGADAVYDAALRRAGMLRVFTLEDLFEAVETLARAKPLQGERLLIMTNGGGPGVMATDTLVLHGGKLAGLSDVTRQQLDAILPSTWSRGNPVDIIGDATAERYEHALRILLKEPQADALLIIHAPTAIVPSDTIAQALAKTAQRTPRNLLTCWLGADAAVAARRTFAKAGLPSYDTPGHAVHAFLQLVEYRRNQELLMQTPPSAPSEFTPQPEQARSLIHRALAAGRTLLTEPEAKQVLACYGIPVVATRIATTPEQAGATAQALGFPAAVKILSPDITHKSDVGGVALDLASVAAVRAAAEAMQQRLRTLQPNARLEGFSVQPMARRPQAHELIVGASTDPVFGPVILFGQGGTAVEVIGDRALALPPLNMALAHALIARTRVARLLAGYRDRPAADRDAIALTLIQVAQLLTDLPEVIELDINPLFADDQGVLALDARIKVEPTEQHGDERLAIRPYPRELEERVQLNGQTLLLRPIRPEDEPQHQAFFESLSEEDIHFRFFGMVRRLPHSQLARYTQIDYDREMAFIATTEGSDRQPHTLGVVRAVADPDNIRAEFAIVVRSDMKGKGLGTLLLKKLIRYCRQRGLSELAGETLRSNQRMLALAQELGFTIRPIDDETVGLMLMLS